MNTLYIYKLYSLKQQIDRGFSAKPVWHRPVPVPKFGFRYTLVVPSLGR